MGISPFVIPNFFKKKSGSITFTQVLTCSKISKKIMSSLPNIQRQAMDRQMRAITKDTDKVLVNKFILKQSKL